jgi:hypothetical protein
MIAAKRGVPQAAVWILRGKNPVVKIEKAMK